MDGRGRRRDLRGLWGAVLLALPLGFLQVVGGSAPAARSVVSVCGYVKNHVVTTTSVPVGTYCPNSQDPRCHPSFPGAGATVTLQVGTSMITVVDALVCVHWDQ
jgi:hypothetical protein